MRRALFFWLTCSIGLASESNTITISLGMNLVNANAAFEKYGYEYGDQHGLAIVASNLGQAIEFVRIDSDTTLVINYLKSTSNIASLRIVVIPEHAPKLNRAEVSLEVLAISLNDDDTYTLKLKRNTGTTTESK
jgi:hypothetical protein